MSIYCTRDLGRLHIGIDQYYQGSINSYKNCFAKFFMKLFQCAFDVSINGKSYCVNKRSYNKFLNIQGILHRYFPLTAPMTLNTSQGFMREHLSSQKTKRLWQKMVTAIKNKQPEVALKKLGQGAEVNRPFMLREETLVFDIKPGVLTCQMMPTDIAPTAQPERLFLLTPYLYAHLQNLDRRVETSLVTFGADPLKEGFTCLFSRKITNQSSATTTASQTRNISYNNAPYPETTYEDTYENRETLDTSQTPFQQAASDGSIKKATWACKRGRHTTMCTIGALI